MRLFGGREIMAGYRRVNYYELCRLCTSSEGTKMHIFREEGRRRSLPSKIQTCLPLQVQEEDSLPKIICSSCVEKLESYFEFREACINAEAMLESYFTSLKYSDDLTREGKVSVYVKDEPARKKDEATTTKVKIPVSSVTNLGSVTSVGDGNTLLPSAIQILTDTDGNRLTQYKVQVQGGIPALVPYGEQTALPLSMSIPSITPQHVKQSQILVNNSSTKSDDATQTNSETIPPPPPPPPPPLVTAVAIASHNQDILQQIGLATKDRNAIAEVLKFKNINVLDATSSCDSITVTNSHIQGNQISQMPNLIPAPIRLDENQLNQLITSNLQIKLSQLQQTTQQSTSIGNGANDNNVLQNKIVNITRSGLVQMGHNQNKGDGEEKGGNERKLEGSSEAKRVISTPSADTTIPKGGNDKLNNSFSGKSSITDAVKQDGSLKFEGNGVELSSSLEEDMEDLTDGGQHGGNGEDNQSYECDTCTKTFKRKEHLFQHKKSHSGERPFVCSTCSKAFSRKEHLLRHNVSHTGQKLHTCDVCQKSFSRKDNLHKHKKTHGINGPHVCEICGKSFVFKHYYVMHKSQHENISNTENSTGTTVKYLTSTNSTTNPLPFKCDLCTKSFSVKSYLTSHRLRHRNRIKQEIEDGAETQQSQQQQQQTQTHQPQDQEHQTSSEITVPQPTILTSFPTTPTNLNLATLNTQLTTINPNALLAPNILHHSSANVVHIGNNSYLCTPNVTSELLEQYRRIHSS